MKKLGLGFLAFVALMLISHGLDPRGQIDPAFYPYVRDFEATVGAPVRGVGMSFEDLEDSELGLCTFGLWSNEITIDSRSWATMSEPGQEQLIFHELGHCFLNLDHENAVVYLNGFVVEGSLMNEYWFGDSDHYARYRNEYKKALKNGSLIGPKVQIPSSPSFMESALSFCTSFFGHLFK